MIVRLTRSTRRIVLAIAVITASGLTYYAIQEGVSVYYAEQGTLEGYEKATQLAPMNAKNWRLLGRYWQLDLEHADQKRAVEAYRRSLALDPRSAGTWLDLASIYDSQGALDAAREAFIKAKEAYPISAEVTWRYGNFLLRTGELDAARREIHQAVQGDPTLGWTAFSVLQHYESDSDTILNQDLPRIPSVYLDTIWALQDDQHSDVTLKIWARLFELRKAIPQSDVPVAHFQPTRKILFSLVDRLVSRGPLNEARRVWDEVLSFMAIERPGDPPDSLVWDGGFETDITGGGLSWRIQPPAGSVFHYDQNTKHSGKRSLQIRFDGKRNLDFQDVCEFVLVTPETLYDLSAWLRTDAITTDRGIFLRLNTPQNVAPGAATPALTGTNPWTRIKTEWRAPKDVRLLQVCLVRIPSTKLDNRIAGTVWLDDVELRPRFSER